MIQPSINTPSREETLERKAQEFFVKFGRRPYGLALALVAKQVSFGKGI